MRKGDKVILAGVSGFLGNSLAASFIKQGINVIILSRKVNDIAGAKTVYWDGSTMGEWAQELEEAKVLINLSGRSVDCRCNDRNKKEIMNSRVLSTRIFFNRLKFG